MSSIGSACPICKGTLSSQLLAHEIHPRFDCRRCGVFRLDRIALNQIDHYLPALTNKWDIVSHAVRRSQQRDSELFLDLERLKLILASEHLPNPIEQAENLVLYLGDQSQGAGSYVHATVDAFCALMGTTDRPGEQLGFAFIRRHVQDDQHLIESDPPPDRLDAWIEIKFQRVGALWPTSKDYA